MSDETAEVIERLSCAVVAIVGKRVELQDLENNVLIDCTGDQAWRVGLALLTAGQKLSAPETLPLLKDWF